MDHKEDCGGGEAQGQLVANLEGLDHSAHMTTTESSSIHLMLSFLLGQTTHILYHGLTPKYAAWERVNHNPGGRGCI